MASGEISGLGEMWEGMTNPECRADLGRTEAHTEPLAKLANFILVDDLFFDGRHARSDVGSPCFRQAASQPAFAKPFECIPQKADFLGRGRDEVDKFVRRASCDGAEKVGRRRDGVDDRDPARLDGQRKMQ